MRALLWLCALAAAAPLRAEPGLKRGASLYHQGRYDSALAVLDSSRHADLKRRDSLILFQYSGMAAARLGRADAAAEDFRALLALDSLFQFPRNEDPAVLNAFAKAKTSRAAPAAPVATAPSVPPPAAPPGPAPAGRFVFADSGPAAHAPPSDAPRAAKPRRIGFVLGAVPLGGGWVARGRWSHGLVLGFLQAGGLALSLYASSRISSAESDRYGIRDESELSAVQKWQWTQRVALSTALGAYLFSLAASTGE